MNSLNRHRIRLSAFSLAETLVGLLIVSAIFMVSYGSYVTMQKGFGFITNWSSVRNSMLRVIDAIEIDLRNATKVTISSSTNNLQTLTLQIPDHYQSYYPSTSLRAGEPNAAMVSGTIIPSGSLGGDISSGTLSIVYSWSSYGSSGQQLVRSGTWIDTTGATQTASRTIASFDYSPTLNYYLQSTGTTLTSTATTGTTLKDSTAPGVCIQLSGTYNVFGSYRQTGTFQSVVNLRALSILQ